MNVLKLAGKWSMLGWFFLLLGSDVGAQEKRLPDGWETESMSQSGMPTDSGYWPVYFDGTDYFYYDGGKQIVLADTMEFLTAEKIPRWDGYDEPASPMLSPISYGNGGFIRVQDRRVVDLRTGAEIYRIPDYAVTAGGYYRTPGGEMFIALIDLELLCHSEKVDREGRTTRTTLVISPFFGGLVTSEQLRKLAGGKPVYAYLDLKYGFHGFGHFLSPIVSSDDTPGYIVELNGTPFLVDATNWRIVPGWKGYDELSVPQMVGDSFVVRVRGNGQYYYLDMVTGQPVVAWGTHDYIGKVHFSGGRWIVFRYDNSRESYFDVARGAVIGGVYDYVGPLVAGNGGGYFQAITGDAAVLVDLEQGTNRADLIPGATPEGGQETPPPVDLAERAAQYSLRGNDGDAFRDYEIAFRNGYRFEDSQRYRYAKAALEIGAVTSAAVQYEWLVQQYPEDPAALLGRGEVFFRQGRYREAKDYYQKVLAIEPDNRQALKGVINCEEGPGVPPDSPPESGFWQRLFGR